MLRKDIDSHERDDSWKHNRLLLGKAKEQQHINQHVQQSRDEAKHHLEEQQKDLMEMKQAHDELKDAHDEVKQEFEELKDAHEKLKARVTDLDHEVIIFRVKHAVLTGREPFIPVDPSFPTWIYPEEKVVKGHKLCIVVDTKVKGREDRGYYGIYLSVDDGPVPCQVTWTFELLHHDGNPESAVKEEDEYTFTAVKELCCLDIIYTALLASPDNPYVKDGYVTFKCTLKIVDE
jgi:hypothetical protein